MYLPGNCRNSILAQEEAHVKRSNLGLQHQMVQSSSCIFLALAVGTTYILILGAHVVFTSLCYLSVRPQAIGFRAKSCSSPRVFPWVLVGFWWGLVYGSPLWYMVVKWLYKDPRWGVHVKCPCCGLCTFRLRNIRTLRMLVSTSVLLKASVKPLRV